MNELFRMRFTAPRMTAESDEAEIMLYGEIVGDMSKYFKEQYPQDKSASDFDAAIKQARADGAKKLRLRINSPGGIVSQAVAMRAILADAGFESVEIRIEGLCASAATIPATLPGAHVVITPGSEYMIHNPWTIALGNAEQMEQTAAHLRTEEETIRGLYVKKTGRADEEVRQWMDAETWMTAEEAVAFGFADALFDEDSALPSAACVSPRTMNAMRDLYAKVPEEKIAVLEEEVSITGSPVSENNTREEDNQMDLSELTLEQLRAERSDLVEAIQRQSTEDERTRINEIDDLTPAGYETMAEAAKRDGTSAVDFCKQIVKAQREKGAKFLENRAQETAAADSVRGGAAEDNDGADDADAVAREIAGYAAASGHGAEGMY